MQSLNILIALLKKHLANYVGQCSSLKCTAHEQSGQSSDNGICVSGTNVFATTLKNYLGQEQEKTKEVIISFVTGLEVVIRW